MIKGGGKRVASIEKISIHCLNDLLLWRLKETQERMNEGRMNNVRVHELGNDRAEE